MAIHFLSSCINNFLKENLSNSPVPLATYGPEKRKSFLTLPYCGKNSLKIKRQLLGMYSTVLPNVDLKIIFKPVWKLQCLSKLKSGIPLLSRSKVVYKISCNNCNEFYVGLTTRRLEQRISEHIKNDASALYKHAVETGHDIAFSRPEILTSDDIELRLQVKETLMIRDLYAYRSLNNMKSSVVLTLW